MEHFSLPTRPEPLTLNRDSSNRTPEMQIVEATIDYANGADPALNALRPITGGKKALERWLQMK